MEEAVETPRSAVRDKREQYEMHKEAPGSAHLCLMGLS